MRLFGTLLLAASTAAAAGATVLPAQPPAGAPSPDRGAAQGGRGGRSPHGERDARRGGMRVRLLRDITLSDAQRAQVRTINDRFRTQHRQLRDDARARRQGRRPADGAARPDSATRAAFRTDREALRGRVRELRQRHLAELRAVLTPAQQASFDRNVAELRSRGAARAARWRERGRAPQDRAPRDRAPQGPARPDAR
jgi:Spy/CpxP family protein refolding chaperone